MIPQFDKRKRKREIWTRPRRAVRDRNAFESSICFISISFVRPQPQYLPNYLANNSDADAASFCILSSIFTWRATIWVSTVSSWMYGWFFIGGVKEYGSFLSGKESRIQAKRWPRDDFENTTSETRGPIAFCAHRAHIIALLIASELIGRPGTQKCVSAVFGWLIEMWC